MMKKSYHTIITQLNCFDINANKIIGNVARGTINNYTNAHVLTTPLDTASALWGDKLFKALGLPKKEPHK